MRIVVVEGPMGDSSHRSFSFVLEVRRACPERQAARVMDSRALCR
nr:MAG TPA_asm: hypothetical protein [Caudoviricetes sp.]